jgi:ABC-type transport system involved in multi-copper enzyme maturation permease subunit
VILTQTAAILLDAYRELNSRKLFWFSLVISGIVVAAFAAIGLSERGVTLLWWEFPSEINTRVLPADVLYRFVFTIIAIPYWLGWGAMILAIVSTAGMIPDFVAGGSVELTLSKPIGRVRLILTKFAAAMIFATLQVTVFTAACFLVIGLRGHSWDPSVFLAVPLIMLVFSYLYSICFLLGVVTRSTIASMLLTMLVWLLVFGVNTTEQVFLSVRITNDLRQERLTAMIADLHEQSPEDTAALDRRIRQLDETRASGATIRRGHQIAYAVKSLLPKTQETLKLLDRALLTQNERGTMQSGGRPPPPISLGDDVRIRPRDIQGRVDDALRARSVAWVIGTSLAFEFVMVGLGAWLFARRDF